MSVLFTFPGQGAQLPGLLHQLPDHREVRRTLHEASDVLGRDVLALDSENALRSTVAVQLCLLVAGVASARALIADACRPDLVAGLSVGAFAAATVAEAIDFADALGLVERRGRLMEQAYPAGYGMLAVIGLDAWGLEPLCAQARRRGHTVYLANINADRQLVVAGADAALNALSELVLGAGPYRVERLAVSVPSHCPLLDAAAAQLAAVVAGTRRRRPRITYLSASAARAIHDPDRLADDLAFNMARLVRWHDTAQLAVERGARLAVEMPPGNVLTRLIEPVLAPGNAVALTDHRIDTVQALIARQHAGGQAQD